MGLLSTIRAVIAPRYNITVVGSSGGPLVAGMDTVQLYRTQPNLQAVVSYLSDNAASVPWKVYDRESDTDRVRITDSPAALLLSQPNPTMTGFDLRQRIFSDMYLANRFLALVMPDKDAQSGWVMWPIPFTWLDGYVGGTVYYPDSFVLAPSNGSRQEVPADRCLWIHGYDPSDPMRQTSPVESLKDMLLEQVESATFRRQMWQRGGRFNAYVSRPKDVDKWDDAAFERFKRTFNESWAGADGADAGRMPILEDGMRIEQLQFNAKEAEWSEAKKLGREDVAGVYHVNPALIWPGSGQTYASARDNARALYNDTLAPMLMKVTDKITQRLLPMIGEPTGHYVEYDLQIKLQGTFEEYAQVIQSSVGGPWLTRNEARAKFNYPAIDGADELIVPLNVLEGGLASPRDTDPTKGAEAHTKCGCEGCKSEGTEIRYKAEPLEEESKELVDAFAKFFERQSRSVLPKIRAAKAAGRKDDDWWDVTRWDRELTEDLETIAYTQSEAAAKRALIAMGVPEDMFSLDTAKAFLQSMCQQRAAYVNETTRRELERSLELEAVGAEGLKATPEGVFENAIENRSVSAGTAMATAIDGWSALEGLRQADKLETATKTWIVTSANPRASHAAMNGKSVRADEKFSNGMDWPGDWAGGPDEVCGCQCTIELSTTE